MNNKAKQADTVNQKKTFNLSTKIDKTDKLTISSKVNNLSNQQSLTLNSNLLNSHRNKMPPIINNHKTTSNCLSVQGCSSAHLSAHSSAHLNAHSFVHPSTNNINGAHHSVISTVQSNSKSNQIDKSTPSNDYSCQLCELNFGDIERLNFHLIKIHKIDKRINLIQCYVNGCEEKFKKRMELVRHLNLDHKLNVVVVTKLVDTLDEFFKWKEKTEKETGFKWILNNKFFLNNRLRKTYICNRSASNGSKLYSLHGLTTINSHSTFCLSSIKVTENDNGQFLIEFIETHNHDE